MHSAADLKKLSNEELRNSVKDLVFAEDLATLDVCNHLSEIEARHLYAKLGFASMYAFVTEELGYTGSSALRRIRVSRVGRRFPEVFELLRKGELSLSSVSACSELLLNKDGEQLLSKLKNMRAREAEELAKAFRPVPAVRDTIERVLPPRATNNSQLFSNYLRQSEVALKAEASAKNLSEVKPDVATVPEQNSNYLRQSEVEVAAVTQVPQAVTEERFKVSFAASKSFIEKLEEAKALSFRGQKEDLLLENILSEALDCFLEKHSPKEREARRERREKKRTPLTVDESARAIPLWLRDKVLKRDNYRCSFISAEGRQCGCRADLEIDHIIPFAKGGKTSLENLRTLCRTHNYVEALAEFGQKHVERRIAERREV